jgi:hypothetical protein
MAAWVQQAQVSEVRQTQEVEAQLEAQVRARGSRPVL